MFATYVSAPRVRTYAGAALVAGAFGIAALASAGTASALSSADDTFLNDISAQGIGYDSPKAAIVNAHQVCAALDGGADPVDIGMEILDNTDLTTDQVATFVVTSVGDYCPDHSALFG
jgi:hypothetical protein